MKFLPKIFFSSLILSLIILKIFYPKSKTYIKTPSIDEEISSVYVDNNNIKYRYYRKEL